MSYSPGGTSGGNIHTDGDVALSNATDGQVLQYNGSLAKWQNQPGSASAPIYLTWSGSDYLPTNLKATTTRGKIFTGPTDPSTVSGVTLSTYDTWNQTS